MRSTMEETPVFMRVRRTAPCFTFNLPERFVNGNSSVFSDIYRVFVDFLIFRAFSADFE
jgi:hypothetical protein